jgi:predicted TIM-barrel fold metal-dependent hydrolase
VLRVLERRSSAPCVTWLGARWRVDLPGEPSFELDPAQHDPETRAERLDVERALVAMSPPVGAEALPARDAFAVVAAWHQAAQAFPEALGWWSATPSSLPEDEAEIARQAVADGAVGLCLPATRLVTPAHADRVLPLLAAVSSAGAPVFVHPGPVVGPGGTQPAWWSPATDYVAQQHAAWHAFHHVVRPQLPELRCIFALLAGLAPLHAERTAQRGGSWSEAALDDQLCFYDTSSYGPRAVRAMVTAVGIGQLVHGSDYPVASAPFDPVEAAFSAGLAELVRRDGAARALGHSWVPA